MGGIFKNPYYMGKAYAPTRTVLSGFTPDLCTGERKACEGGWGGEDEHEKEVFRQNYAMTPFEGGNFPGCVTQKRPRINAVGLPFKIEKPFHRGGRPAARRRGAAASFGPIS